MSVSAKQKKQLRVEEASAAYLVETQQTRHSGEGRNPVPLAHLAKVAEINPRRYSNQPDDAELVSFIPMKAVEEETGRLDASEMRPWRDVKKGYTPFQDGDVIFAKITPCMENGKFALAKELHNGRAAGSTEFHVFRPGPKLDAEYLLHFLFTPELRSNAKRKMQGAAGQLRVTTNFFDDVEIPLPPLDVQRQIVAEIEKQFTRLETGLAALRRVQANLKRYRAAVLKAACEGRLVRTEAELAKKEGRAYESADKLLARILNERREKWTGRGQYKEPAASDITNLPSLPEGWAWASLAQLSWASSYGTSVKCSYEHSGPPVLRIPNIASGRIDLTDLKFSGAAESIDDGDELTPGDLLIIRTNGSKNLIGRSAVVREKLSEATNYASYLIRFRLACESILFAWLGAIWDCSFLRAWIEKRAATSAGQHNISMSVLSTLPVPIPPPAEQERIVAEVERLLSVVEEQEAVVSVNLHRATRLRQAVLQCAFSP